MFNIQLCRVVTLLMFIMGIFVGAAQSQEPTDKPTTLAQRLKSVTHVGLRHNPQLGGYTVKIYSKEHATQTVEERDNTRKDSKAVNERIEALQHSLQKSRAGNTSRAETEALDKELARAQASRRDSAVPETLYRVIAVGLDYIELEMLNDTDVERILPFHSISSIQVVKASKTASEDNAKRD